VDASKQTISVWKDMGHRKKRPFAVPPRRTPLPMAAIVLKKCSEGNQKSIRED
jgi:hypothetical protein